MREVGGQRFAKHQHALVGHQPQPGGRQCPGCRAHFDRRITRLHVAKRCLRIQRDVWRIIRGGDDQLCVWGQRDWAADTHPQQGDATRWRLNRRWRPLRCGDRRSYGFRRGQYRLFQNAAGAFGRRNRRRRGVAGDWGRRRCRDWARRGETHRASGLVGCGVFPPTGGHPNQGTEAGEEEQRQDDVSKPKQVTLLVWLPVIRGYLSAAVAGFLHHERRGGLVRCSRQRNAGWRPARIGRLGGRPDGAGGSIRRPGRARRCIEPLRPGG